MTSTTYRSDYKHLLEELREARVQAGMTQMDLAVELGRRQTYVSKCELGQRRLDVMELRSWVTALGGDLAAFIEALEARISRHEVPSLRRS